MVDPVQDPQEGDQVAQHGLRADREDDEQHDASHGHAGDAEILAQEDQAEEHADHTCGQDAPFELVHRLDDVAQDHEAYDGHQDRAGGGDIHRAYVEGLAKDDQTGDDDEVGQGGGQSLEQDVRDKTSADHLFVRQLGEQETGQADGEQADQRDLGRTERVGHPCDDREDRQQQGEDVFDQEQASGTFHIVDDLTAFHDDLRHMGEIVVQKDELGCLGGCI